MPLIDVKFYRPREPKKAQLSLFRPPAEQLAVLEIFAALLNFLMC
jgi:hypothetical protein